MMVNFAFTIDTVTNDAFFFKSCFGQRERCILSDKMCVMVTVLTVNYTHLGISLFCSVPSLHWVVVRLGTGHYFLGSTLTSQTHTLSGATAFNDYTSRISTYS